VDGEPQLSRTKAPYSAELRLASFPREQVVKAEGYDAEGELVAADEVMVNQTRGAFRVLITEPAEGEKIGRRTKDIAALTPADAMAIGVSQALAVVPGTSRSGITMTAGLFRDLDRPTAARFSFLLSTPAIGAAAGKALYEMYKKDGLHGMLATDFLLGIAISTVTGCIVIAWFLHYLRRSGLRPFVYYRIIFGIIVIALAFIRRPA